MRTLKILVVFPVLFLALSCAFRKHSSILLGPFDFPDKHSGRFYYQTWQSGELSENNSGVALVKNVRPEYRAALKETILDDRYPYPLYDPKDVIGLKAMIYGNTKNKESIQQVIVFFDQDGKTNLFLILFLNPGVGNQTIEFYFWKKNSWIPVPVEISHYGFSFFLSKYIYSQTRRLLYFHN